MRILVTGGAGFIGANFVAHLLAHGAERVVVLDALTYAGNLQNLIPIQADPRYRFVKGSILDKMLVGSLLETERLDTVANLAAESHVDRSIRGPETFVETNVTGTLRMLEASRAHLDAHPELRNRFRYLQVSTDEVFGTLGLDDPKFCETTPYAPNSPYAASKAAADHLVRAWHETYGLATMISTCSNNYGPYQFPEKLIPLVIQTPSVASRCRSMATGSRCATGCMSMTMHRRSAPSSPAARQGKPTRSAAIPSGPISMSSAPFATCSTGTGRAMPARTATRSPS